LPGGLLQERDGRARRRPRQAESRERRPGAVDPPRSDRKYFALFRVPRQTNSRPGTGSVAKGEMVDLIPPALKYEDGESPGGPLSVLVRHGLGGIATTTYVMADGPAYLARNPTAKALVEKPEADPPGRRGVAGFPAGGGPRAANLAPRTSRWPATQMKKDDFVFLCYDGSSREPRGRRGPHHIGHRARRTVSHSGLRASDTPPPASGPTLARVRAAGGFEGNGLKESPDLRMKGRRGSPSGRRGSFAR